MAKVIAISDRGQITIPNDLRAQLKVKYLLCSLDKKGALVLSPLQTKDEFLSELEDDVREYKKNRKGISLNEVGKKYKLS